MSFNILEHTEFKGRIVLFNGTNSDPLSREIYRKWLEKNKDTDRISGSKTADMRAAIVDCIREEAVIMIASRRPGFFSCCYLFNLLLEQS